MSRALHANRVSTYGLFINVHLDEDDVLEVGFSLFEVRRDHLARTTPGRP